MQKITHVFNLHIVGSSPKMATSLTQELHPSISLFYPHL